MPSTMLKRTFSITEPNHSPSVTASSAPDRIATTANAATARTIHPRPRIAATASMAAAAGMNWKRSASARPQRAPNDLAGAAAGRREHDRERPDQGICPERIGKRPRGHVDQLVPDRSPDQRDARARLADRRLAYAIGAEGKGHADRAEHDLDRRLVDVGPPESDERAGFEDRGDGAGD